MRALFIALAVGCSVGLTAQGQDLKRTTGAVANGPVTARVVSLDGNDWLLATDAKNVGRLQQWFHTPRPEAKRTKVPWIIQDAFPGYHGVAWYWHTFTAPANPHVGGRYLLRFWAVDYLADVWLNGKHMGGHENGETPFVLDVTDAINSGGSNSLAVRVLNPTHEPIDGIVLKQIPHRNKEIPYRAGASYNHGGIVDSVELLITPAVRVEDLFVCADAETGVLRIRANIRNAGAGTVDGKFEFAVAPAASGETVAFTHSQRKLPVGDTLIETDIEVKDPHLWDLNDPFLYRVTARAWTSPPQSDESEGKDTPRQAVAIGGFDEYSVRCGFRDFRFTNGYFRLNGRRIFLKCSHTGNHCPIGQQLPHDPDLLRRDLHNVKVMGFNAIRFIAGVATRYQLDLCDEIGLLVYEEPYANWCLQDSPKMAERFDRSVGEMILRDRNHPSIVIWGLLNETPDGPVFRHAVETLKLVRTLDDSRMVTLNSGRWDQWSDKLVAGIDIWRPADRTEPCVNHNGTPHTVRGLGITWEPGQLGLHPGREGEPAVLRWTAPAKGTFDLSAKFKSIAVAATTDVHVLHNGKSLFDGLINVDGKGPETPFLKRLSVEPGDRLDFAVGFGNGSYGADSTGLELSIKSEQGKTYDPAASFGITANPNGVWSYGYLPPRPAAESLDTSKFIPFPTLPTADNAGGIGGLSNPGSMVWENVLDDQHCYPRVPHTAAIIRSLREYRGGDNPVGLPEHGFPPRPPVTHPKPVFLSEYGIGSAVDLIRVVGLYEQLGKAEAEDARFYRNLRDRFLADWKRWRLEEAFDRPEDFFEQSIAKMAGQRTLGLLAIRSNPQVVAHSITGTVDQGMTGEGLFTTFRELKPGTVDAVFDGWAPLRWCLFAEPGNVYRNTSVRLEAVLANEDVLAPGEYPVRLQVIGPKSTRVLDRAITVTIPEQKGSREPPFALPVFGEDVVIDGPSGKYRFVATFEKGAAAAGGEAVFYVADPREMPSVDGKIVIWGQDDQLAAWLAERGIAVVPFDADDPAAGKVILVSGRPAAPGDASAFAGLTRRIERGATAVFLSPDVFKKGDDADGWLPVGDQCSLGEIRGWLYLKDEWAKDHPIFAGLPAGGLMDYRFYREIIPDRLWFDKTPPDEAVAGAIKASQDYSAGLTVAVYRLGEGRVILNTLRIRSNLGSHPAAERLLLNMLRYAAGDVKQPPADVRNQIQ
ncbi:MAG: glycoside hydrolase family 2 [Planctomycetes bacterium]|nr:glycoside hydrolase family 2 [Planctomycetota bacterium]